MNTTNELGNNGNHNGGTLSINDWSSAIMRKGKTTRLEIHRLKYNQIGRRGTLLKMSELNDAEKALISQEVLQDVRVKRLDFTGDMDEQIFDEVQSNVLAEWGVMCPHSLTEQGIHPHSLCCITCGAILLSVPVVSNSTKTNILS